MMTLPVEEGNADEVTPRRGADDLVSILMPMRNAVAHVAEAISSCRVQTHQRWELLVVDDGSTDGSGDLVSCYQDLDPRVKLVATSSGVGPGEARNLALHAAQGEWVTVLDADDVYHRQRLERLVAFAHDDGGRSIYVDRIARWPSVDEVSEEIRGGTLPEVVGVERRWELDAWLSDSRAGQPFLALPPLRTAEVRYPPTSMGEDTAFVVRAAVLGGLGPIVQLADLTYIYRKLAKAWSGLSAPSEQQLRQLAHSMELLLPEIGADSRVHLVIRRLLNEARTETAVYALRRAVRARSAGEAVAIAYRQPKAIARMAARGVRNRVAHHRVGRGRGA